MSKRLSHTFAALAAATALIAVVPATAGGVNWSIDIGGGYPAYYPPAPVYYPPPPVYNNNYSNYYAPPIIYGSTPVYQAPPPIIVYGRSYYRSGPPRDYYRGRGHYDHRGGHGHGRGPHDYRR